MSVFSSLKPQGGQNLQAFDLSRRDVYHIKSGVLNVNFFLDTLPESKYEVNHASITRLDPIQTASFSRMSENYEYYFVPYSQLFYDFERLYYERGDAQRNVHNYAFNDIDLHSSLVPTFSFHDVVDALADYYICSRVYLKMKQQDDALAEVFFKRFLDTFSPTTPLQSYLPTDVHGEVCIDEMLKLFDSLGYGNLFPVFRSLIDPLFGFTSPSTALGSRAEVEAANSTFQASLNQLFRNYSSYSQQVYYLFQLHAEYSVLTPSPSDVPTSVLPNWYYLGDESALFDFFHDTFFHTSSEYDCFRLWLDGFAGSSDRRPTILHLAAYTKVFSDIYRNQQYDNINYSNLFNFDYVNSDILSRVDTAKVIAMLLPRFRQYKKDVFTGGFPNAQFGSVAVAPIDNPVEISATAAHTGSADKAVYVDRTTKQLYNALNTGNNTKYTIDTAVSAIAIRQALSLQRYKERLLRAGNRLTSLQNAIFGDRSRFIENNYVQFIGAEKSYIDFNSVAATSDSGKSEVGQLGSNGVCTHVGKAFEFHSHDFGVIIGIHYVLPESEYESFMIDPSNTKSESNDYYKPDFMNLGLSPVFNYNFNILGSAFGGSSLADKVLSYLANYWEYKTSIDKVHGLFYGSLPFDLYTVPSVGEPRWYLPDVNDKLAYTRGAFANYVCPRHSSAFRDGMYLSSLYVNPHDIDSIFYVNSDFTALTDQFKVNSNHDVKALLPMSVIGLPTF